MYTFRNNQQCVYRWSGVYRSQAISWFDFDFFVLFSNVFWFVRFFHIYIGFVEHIVCFYMQMASLIKTAENPRDMPSNLQYESHQIAKKKMFLVSSSNSFKPGVIPIMKI